MNFQIITWGEQSEAPEANPCKSFGAHCKPVVTLAEAKPFVAKVMVYGGWFRSILS